MTAQEACTSRTRASHGAVRWARAAVIALLTAIAVLMHHETTAVPAGSPSSSAAHAAMPGMVTPAGPAAPSAIPTKSSADDPACSGTAMQHCSAAGLEVVKLPVPLRTFAPGSLAAPGAAATGPKAAGTVERAPPDLSVLSQLRI
ncbi:hypothetical protein IM697_27165 [Streptomyces ferrugineus]|uniref:Uncharacterized protein n=1 Tax=Streptomyces ferrugineus TaxID=1413221 RepID=A0A7M2SF87_9ACTN|nr:hypothetical protein [Streptomyces ferrugineus]QOV33861.1 hypothetical protein IM697_27165 [Streptomyces ferrugineus]